MQITRVFLECDMRCGFEGLRKIADDAGSKLGPNSTVLFINRRMTAFKMIAADQFCIYYKNGQRRIPLDALRHLPQFFGGSEMEMKGAIRKTLRDNLKWEFADEGRPALIRRSPSASTTP